MLQHKQPEGWVSATGENHSLPQIAGTLLDERLNLTEHIATQASPNRLTEMRVI
ncbi:MULTISPECIES: hypothetical protein [unclassified Microcoleus]|uniref:hypothetical protein n=1 Tax=unclassified Microcoleus TaxID=2642155 RepID=UPI002FD3D57A